MADDIAEQHARALDATRLIVHGVRADQMALPTPCDAWDVRSVLNHVIAGNLWAAELADGKTIEEVGDRLDGDVVGDDPGSAYDRSADAAAAAFRRPGALQAPCAVSYGPVPGSMYAGHRFLDVLIHGWDLAKGTGQDTMIDPALVQTAWDILTPQLELLRGSGMFGEDVDIPADADAQTRLLAALGRRP